MEGAHKCQGVTSSALVSGLTLYFCCLFLVATVSSVDAVWSVKHQVLSTL